MIPHSVHLDGDTHDLLKELRKDIMEDGFHNLPEDIRKKVTNKHEIWYNNLCRITFITRFIKFK